MPKSILVTGANGQLGSELQQFAPIHPELNFTFVTNQWGQTRLIYGF